MNIESSSKIWAVIFSAIIIGIIGYFGYNFYFPKQEIVVLEDVITPSPTPVPFRWDLYLDAEDATGEAKTATSSATADISTTKGGIINETNNKKESTKTSVTKTPTTVAEVQKTTITTTTTTNENGKVTSETKTYTVDGGSYVIEVKAEAHAEASVSN